MNQFVMMAIVKGMAMRMDEVITKRVTVGRLRRCIILFVMMIVSVVMMVSMAVMNRRRNLNISLIIVMRVRNEIMQQ